jgi:choline dehydrogenase-like flavoprotein
MTKRPDGVFGREDFTRDTVLECDAVIVGSGAGGGVMAAELAEAGLEVIVLEEGGYHGTEEFKPEASQMIRTLYRDGGAAMTIGTPPIIFSEGRTVGGSTVINGARRSWSAGTRKTPSTPSTRRRWSATSRASRSTSRPRPKIRSR